MRSLRGSALDKLATLSAKSPASTVAHSDLSKLCRLCPTTYSLSNGYKNGDPSRVAMTLSELEVLFALCKAAPLIQNIDNAEQLLFQLSRYVPESPTQAIAPSPFLKELEPSPWESLSYLLTNAVLSIGANHPLIRDKVATTILRYLEEWIRTAGSLAADQFDSEDVQDYSAHREFSKVVTLAMSLLGFMRAGAEQARFWTTVERMELIKLIKDALSDKFMVALETALSIIRNATSFQRGLKDWKRYAKHYAAIGRPLGAMLLQEGFMHLVVACTSLLVAPWQELSERPLLDYLQVATLPDESDGDFGDEELLQAIKDIADDELNLLKESNDYYLQVGSAWQQRLASSVKANAFAALLCCSILDQDLVDPEDLLIELESSLAEPMQIADDSLASVVLKCMAVLAKVSPSLAANLGRTLPRVIVQGGLDTKTAKIAAESLTSVLKLLPQDVIITTLYSLGNVLSANSLPEKSTATSPFLNGNAKGFRNDRLYHNQTTGSAISLTPSDMEEPSIVYATVIQTIVGITLSCNDEKITALALSMLIQKIGRTKLPVDAKIITESAILGAHGGPNELRTLLKLYVKLSHDALVQDNLVILEAVLHARNHLAREIKRNSPLFEVCLVHFLDAIISKGDAHDNAGSNLPDAELAAQEIAQLLPPLAIMASANYLTNEKHQISENIVNLQRDAWFNVVVHGFVLTSPLGKKYLPELQTLAKYSRPLIADDRAEHLDSDIELNTVLRRGKSSESTMEQKKFLIEALPACEVDIKSLSYSEVVFLNTAYLVEGLRANSGDCTKALIYFLDEKLRDGATGNCMEAIAKSAVKMYLTKTMTGKVQAFAAPYVAQQLAGIFRGCCYRIAKIQKVAISCADMIIQQVPSALCQKSSLFALLELLTIMWTSCLEGEMDEYEWSSTFTSEREGISLELSDNYNIRKDTLLQFHKCAKRWVLRVIDTAPLDMKGLLQTYLSEYDDDGAYGHVSLGRSFALEMGSAIPSTDQRLGAIEQQQELCINTASDFIAQYTTRQEYRFVDGIQDEDEEWLRYSSSDPLIRRNARLDRSMESANRMLADLEDRTLKHKYVAIRELRDILRRAAALLCKSSKDQCAIVHHLVGIPFAVFSKESIKLGISLWMSVIKENPRMESRILVEIAENWISTVHKKKGLFAGSFHHDDPFYIKQEFAPSDKGMLMRHQHHAYNTIVPHFRLLQFLSSHFNATRLVNPNIERIYCRLIHITLDAMDATTNHPLSREAHFHAVLLGIRILRHGKCLSEVAQWRLKDRILSAALAWFCLPPRFSFGGNRLQIKAETHVLADIKVALETVTPVAKNARISSKLLLSKQELLLHLLTNEQNRLMVWLFPLDYETRHLFKHHEKPPSEAMLSALLKTAWVESPALAVQLPKRFQSQRLASEVRWLLLNFPEKVIDEPDALELLLGSMLPNDISFQLKYMLYWAPVNPITAVTYFLPAYGNHPFIIQYAMRALESHSVDVTFFYVPQIVQTLRYDVMGYVERYIIETAKFSQLFAHQIIWNMKANAYKDEDSQIPDPVKPTLDKVMESLISSFSKKDRDFYEREFSFFNEVTGISGKLRPFIKKSKPEKKQKIEEELRKIKVDVGVYLPSNPDGVVIGIDRKSGKPLQSHAKAPFMATFRIRKEKGGTESTEDILEQTKEGSKENTYEVWQSAIFKVGDDCRQDVLALQMISAFRGIFHSVGLDVYVFPYRVTATAPGCGVIDVLPSSISRDMLGREAVNGLYQYFTSKYGGEDSIRFQEARNNFVKSMAAYSIISYLLQFKDRHNGNIMIDEAGHILHIDFGFCFDIAPGGVRFERAPFKLTSEMVAVMGGSTSSQPYRWFEELCVKAFLASRQHCEHLAHIVLVMLDSGLPCFKPETIQHFRDRFVLDKTDKEAADFVKDLINKSYRSYSTKGYDQFQLLTNGIPY